METSRQGVGPRLRSTKGYSRALKRASLGLVISGLVAGVACLPAADAGAATNSNSVTTYARAQLFNLSNLPKGWTSSGGTWTGTSADGNASSMLTMTQFPDYASCLGKPPELSVDATEASSPTYYSKDQNTSVYDVSDVYANTSAAKADFPPLNNPKFANCFLRVQSSSIMSLEASEWPTGATFGTPVASVSHQPRYGNQSGLIDVEVPVNLPSGEGTSNDFFLALVIRQGRSTAELFIDQGDTTPSAALTESLAKTVTAKMKAHAPGNTIIAT